MKKILTAVAILGTFGASQAFAQVQSHTGFSLAANLAMTSTNTEATVSGLNLNAAGQSSVGAAVQAAFNYAATDSVLLSVGAIFGLADIDALSFSSIGGSGSLKLRNAYSVYLEPGYPGQTKPLRLPGCPTRPLPCAQQPAVPLAVTGTSVARDWGLACVRWSRKTCT